jgi:hypothetical protein
MTVRADNFAFRYLLLDSRERRAVRQQTRDFALLGREVVEVQHYGVALAAINARMAP